MTAIFTGPGAGLARGSASVLGNNGLLGSASTGRGGDNVAVNAATGNLVISRQDEFLVGRGPDLGISRTYNSLAEVSDRDNGDKWQMSTARRVYGLTGTLNTAGSTVKRQGADGSVVTYAYETRGGVAAYWTTDGDGAHEKLVKSGATWIWTDGASQVTETFEASVGDATIFRIKEEKDTDGYKLTFAYLAGTDKLDRVTTHNNGTANAATGIPEQSYVQYVWAGNEITQIVTGYTNFGDGATEADNVNKTLTRTYYTYDDPGRLSSVTVDLSPDTPGIGDNHVYTLSYEYDPTNGLISAVIQSDGSRTDIAYDGAGRVQTLTQTVTTGDTRVTTLSYGATYTNVTGPDGQVTRLDYDSAKQLTKITAPPAYTGATAQTVQFGYDAEGNLTSVTDGAGEVTSYTHDANGNVLTSTDPLGNIVTRTYGAKNELLTETRTGSDATGAAVSHTTRYVYDVENHVHYLVSAEGYVTEYRYNASGQVQYVIEYPEHAYAIGSGALSEATMNAWRDAIADRSSTKIFVQGYDSRDNRYYSLDYGYATAAGAASTAEGYSRTYFAYDQAGRLLSRYGQSENAETFVYDGLGRLTASVDLAGGTTTYRFNDASTTTIVHLATGLTRTMVYNKAGDLISETSSTPGYQPDELYANISDWGYVRMTRTTAAPIGGEDAYTYTMDATGSYGSVSKGVAVAAGETATWRITVKGNPADAHRVGLYGSTEGWGTIAATDASAIIVKGPGSISNAPTYGGLFDLTGLSETQETVIELRRTYTQAQSAGAYFYVGGTGSSVPAGMAVTLAATNLTKTFTDANEDISAAATFAYDQNGRLRVATDATGYKSYYLYDKAGHKIAEINHYGHVTEYRYDAAGRVAASANYTNALTAAQITTLSDPNSVVEMATIRPAAHSYDVWSWSIYDDAGRLIESIDGDGGVAVFSYDASDRLVKTVSYYNKLSVAPYMTTPPAALVLPTANAAKDAVSRTFYDRDGRLIGALDGEGYLSEVIYDKAGQKVEEVAYAALTSSTYWASGTLDQLRSTAAPTSSANRRTRYVYDGQGLLRYTVDNAGYASSYAYNYAGKLTTTIAHAAPISTTDFTYDSVKALVAAIAVDANDRESYSVLNAKGQLAYSIGTGGLVTGLTYDIAGRVTKTVQYAVLRATPSLPALATMDSWAAGQSGNGANHVSRSWYAAGGDLRFTVDAEGYVRRFDYDAEGRLTREVTWPNVVTPTDTTTIAQISTLANGAGTWTDVQYTYDAAGRRSSVYDGEGNRTVYSWYANGVLSSVYYGYVTADQSRTVYVNDGAGRIKAEYTAYGEAEQALVQYAYDGLGNRTSVTDARGLVTTYTYDERGQVLTMTVAAGGITSYEYNAFGEVVKTTDPRGNSTYAYYDNLGRVTKARDSQSAAESYVTETTYTAFGEVQSVTRRYNVTTSAVSTTTPPTVTSHAKDATTTFQYDKLGRVTLTTDALGYTESFGYDAWGNRISATNKLGGTTTYQYDRRGLLTLETLPMASVNDAGTTIATSVSNSFEYDARGNRTKETKAVGLPEQHVTQYVYDRANRLIERIDQTFLSLTPHTYFSYDARGNLTRQTAPDNARTVYFYDDLDRISVEIGAVGTYTAYIYDPNGNATSIKVYETAVTIPADGGSQEEAPAAPAGNYRETAFTYDNVNRMLTSSVIGAATGSYIGTTWTPSTAAITTQYQYDANGNVVKTIDPNGNATWAYYDALARKTVQIDALGYRTNWTYDAEGNVTLEVRYWNAGAIPTSTSTPPALPTADGNLDRSTGYVYDKIGNRTAEIRHYVKVHDGSGGQVLSHIQISYAYNGLGQVTQKTEQTGEAVFYQYDQAGRLIQETKTAFTDHTGVSVTPIVQYGYDGLGNLTRTRQVGNATTADRVTKYGYDGGKLRWMRDAEYNDGTSTDGKYTLYSYDIAGNLRYEYYTRRDSGGANAGGNDYDGVFRVYDGMGRVTQQWNTTYTSAGGWVQSGPTTTTAHNAFGEVASVQVGTGALQQNQYDKAGRLVGSNAGDGVWKYFAYDKAGNQTGSVVSAGTDLTGQTFASARVLSGVAVTYTTFDTRNLATNVHETGRDLSTTVTGQTLLTQRAYNAFGEVAYEIAAGGGRIDYTYSTMGRLIKIESPTVTVVGEDGASSSVRPTEQYYYDLGGRLVAQRDANGNLTRYTLLANTGYGGSQSLVTSETHADGGIKQTKYDIHGDARLAVDEMGRQIQQTFDQMGRAIEVYNLGSTLHDYYQYDVLGQQLKRTNSLLGAGNAEITDYDVQGRVISARAFGGDTTTTTYSFYASIGGFGGWQEVATMANGLARVEQTDIFGKVRYKSDLGGHVFNYTYDVAGRLGSMTQGSATQTYQYFNTGKLRSIALAGSGGGSAPTTTYGYDAGGNLASQSTYDAVYGQTQTLTAAYDALGRMTSWAEAGNATTPAASSTLSYDAKGNVRRVYTTHAVLDGQGTASASAYVQDLWYRYDAMDRVVVSHGALSGGAIVRGSGGKDIYYNLAGQRTQAWSRKIASTWVTMYDPANPNNQYSYELYYETQVREDYTYDSAGRLYQVLSAEGYFDTSYFAQTFGQLPPEYYVSAPGAGSVVGQFNYDTLGRLTLQQDFASGVTQFSRALTYDTAGRISVDDSTTKRGADLYRNVTTQTYLTGASNMLGAANSSATVAYKNGIDGGSNGAKDTSTANTYVWWDSALQASTTFDDNSDPGSSNANFVTTYAYNAFAQLTSVGVDEPVVQTRDRTVTFRNSADGQAIRRDEADGNGSAGDPHDVYYRLGGKQLGRLGNNSTDNVAYTASTEQRTQTPGSGAFRGGATSGSSYADFGLDYDAVNSFDQGSQAGLYQVQAGDTLQGIAQALWGDAALWYKLAEANGLSATSTLAPGRSLTIPTGVQRIHNNAGTFKPYDPAEAIGDTSPTTPKPAKKGKCGVVGQILLAAIAIAITVIAPISGPGVWAAMGNAVIGSVVSQSVGLATGIQDKFSFKGVALAALSAGVSGGIASQFGTGALAGSQIAGDVARGVAGSAITQGIGVATGLQDKFSWAGVAAAGVSAGVVGSLGKNLAPLSGTGLNAGNIASHIAVGGAALIASAATRSAIEGTSFGDNIRAGLPDVLGQVAGQAFAGAIGGTRGGSSAAAAKDTANKSLGSKQVTAQLEKINSQIGSSPVAADGVTVGQAVGQAVSRGGAPSVSGTGGYIYEANEVEPTSHEQIDAMEAAFDAANASLGERLGVAYDNTDDLEGRFSYWHDRLESEGISRAIVVTAQRASASDATYVPVVDDLVGFTDWLGGGIAGYRQDYRNFSQSLRASGFGGQWLSLSNVGAGLVFGTGSLLTALPGMVRHPVDRILFPIAEGLDSVFLDDRTLGQFGGDVGRSLSRVTATDAEMFAGELAPIVLSDGAGIVGEVGSAGRVVAAERALISETRVGTAIQTYWPPNRGFQGASVIKELSIGTRIDRFGREGGTFLSPEGTPDWMRSLEPGTTLKPYNVYEVATPIKVRSGEAAPWFGQLGGGIQYELPMKVSEAIKAGYLRRAGP